jgi:hypothetical protein
MSHHAAAVAVVEQPIEALPINGLAPLTREDLAQHEAAIAAMALEEAVDPDAAPVRIRFRGRTITARPIHLRRFIRCMAPHVSLN